jgi:hypothetical protein
MTPAVIASAVRLADVLARENAALGAMDLARAAAMLAEKTIAAAAFADAQQANTAANALPSPLAREVAARLLGLAQENRRLLEGGIFVQGRLIGSIAKAASRPTAPRYGATGAVAGERARPLTLSARA